MLRKRQHDAWQNVASSNMTRHPRQMPSAKCQMLIYHSDRVSTHRGKFITFEGLDGCGKSTQMEKLAGVLRAQGLSVVVTREPGGTATGEKIRRLLLDTATAGLSPLAELALMFASRAQHITEVIQPALAAGQHRALRPLYRLDRGVPGRRPQAGQPSRYWSCIASCAAVCSPNSPFLWIPMSPPAWSAPAAATKPTPPKMAAAKVTKTGLNRRAGLSSGGCTVLIWLLRRVNRRGVVLVDARGAAGQTHAKIVEIVRRKLRLAAKTA